jgi:exodeoxyribonuclease III
VAPRRTRILSWNVNGVRAVASRGHLAFVAEDSPDYLCLQETKAAREQAGAILSEYPYQYWSSAERRGYSGTAIFARREPLDVRYGMGKREHDAEGRVVTLELERYWLVTVYTPNAQRGLERLDYRMRWDRAFLSYLKALDKAKPVVFCGDLNVAHEEIDLAHPGNNHKNPGFTDLERRGFSRALKAGFVDTFRELHPGLAGQYSWWSYMQNARDKNVGWRIDYVCLSRRLGPWLRDAFILSDVMGSDHCPVGVVLQEPRG